MGERRLATIFSVIGVVTILAVSFPGNQIKANDCGKQCESGKAQTDCPHVANGGAQKAARNQASSCDRHPTQLDIPTPVNQLSPPRATGIQKIYYQDLPLAILSIDNAAKAAEFDDKTTAVVELMKVRKMLISANDLLGESLTPLFANSHCPIMGSPIDGDAVEESLTRDYKGGKIAFCCGGCPLTWDRLTDAQKQYRVRGIKF